jgi:hypothetical protein
MLDGHLLPTMCTFSVRVLENDSISYFPFSKLLGKNSDSYFCNGIKQQRFLSICSGIVPCRIIKFRFIIFLRGAHSTKLLLNVLFNIPIPGILYSLAKFFF